jgi:hypothetical protein
MSPSIRRSSINQLCRPLLPTNINSTRISSMKPSCQDRHSEFLISFGRSRESLQNRPQLQKLITKLVELRCGVDDLIFQQNDLKRCIAEVGLEKEIQQKERSEKNKKKHHHQHPGTEVKPAFSEYDLPDDDEEMEALFNARFHLQ